MGATTKYALPYPEPGELADGPAAFKALADQAEAVISSSTAPTHQVATGALVGGPANSNAWTGTVTFPTPFAGAPVVLTNMTSGTGASRSFVTRAIGITTTAFTYWVVSPTDTVATFSATLQWFAVRST